MLEESRMDKKSQNRSLQLQSRASAVDCKKNTELTHKPLPRNNKKREGSTSKNEPNRKNIPAQRGRGQLDKRPRTRGASALVVGGAQSTGLEDDEEPEIGSVFVPGSKKQNLNHLLNFMYPSRAAQPDRRVAHPAPRRPNQQRVMRWHSQDLYLRANCQFVVKKDGDYIGNILDPDVPMKWEQIEEVIVRSTGKSECPICLGAPVAGRVGLCGHVYCWACVLHYAAAHEKQPPPCPVCTTPLNVKDMKPTKIVQWEAPGEEVTMRLVRRLRGSTTVEIAPPRGYMPENDIDAILPLDKLNDSPYNKLFHATKKQIRDILERERKEIQDQILAEIDTTEVEYLEQALKMLKEKEDNVNAQVERPMVVERPVEQPAPPLIYEGPEINGNRIDWFDVDNEGAGAAAMIDIEEELQHLDIAESNLNPDAPSFEQNDEQPEEFPLVECAAIVEEQSLDKCNFNEYDKINQAKYFYFYQAEDGQQVFLNSLNVRILNASWSALVAAPEVIKGRVLHRETLSLEHQMRKHMPYTAHLPLYCSFDIVELDLQPPYVSPEALDNFKAELDRRARIRARHEREERRRERAYQRAIEGPPRPDFSSEVLFPPAAASSPPLSEASFSPLEQPMPSTSAMPATSPAPGLSFAKMASTTGTWRVRKTSTPPEPPPAEEDVGAPRTLNLSDAIEAALQAPPAPGSKKKKNKQKVLFATGMTMLDKK